MSLTPESRARDVRLALFDVDGVLTDGRLHYSSDGSETKTFHTQDGQGLALLRASGVVLGIISGRRSAAVERRAAELGFAHVLLGIGDKAAALAQLLSDTGTAAGAVAFVGDDWPDLPLFRRVGFAVAVADARPEVRAAAHWITPSAGGVGAARDFAEFVMQAQGTWAAQFARFAE